MSLYIFYISIYQGKWGKPVKTAYLISITEMLMSERKRVSSNLVSKKLSKKPMYSLKKFNTIQNT